MKQARNEEVEKVQNKKQNKQKEEKSPEKKKVDTQNVDLLGFDEEPNTNNANNPQPMTSPDKKQDPKINEIDL